jgi:hypothetical protein
MKRNTSGLRPFPKGVSGNPGGRPKTAVLSKALRKLLASPKPRDKYGRTWAVVIAHALAKKAARGIVVAIKEAGDRTEGRPAQAVELAGRDGADLIPADLPKKVLDLLELVAGHRKRK